MEQIIAPVAVDLLKAELVPARKLRNTNKGNNEIYIVDAHNAPEVMKEIGRIREEAFRGAGGGSGLSMDIDEFDTMEVPYSQLIVWDPDACAILGGYRYLAGPDIKFAADGQPVLATSHMFRFSDEFIKNWLPYTIELGRSFVAPQYQSSKAGAKALFALDNLWDGLGALMLQKPEMKYFFGKMTMYPDYNRYARDLIQHFLFKHFRDTDSLVVPYEPLEITTDPAKMDAVLTGKNFKDDYKILNAEVRKMGVNIPPLVNSYMSLSPHMKMFGGAINHEYSEVEETGILIAFDDIYEEKKIRHVNSFIKDKIRRMKERFPAFAERMGDNLHNMIAQKRKQVQEKIEKRKAQKRRRKGGGN